MEEDNNRDKQYGELKGDNHVRQYQKRDTFPVWYVQTRHAVYYILGIIEVLLAFRLIFRLLGASTGSGFVVFIYSLTGILTAPFRGIFRIFVARGAEAQFVFEPSTIIAMIFYAIASMGIINLIKIKVPENA